MSFKKNDINIDSMEILIDKKEIANKIKQIGREISEKFKGKTPIIVGVLNGSFFIYSRFSEGT